MTSKTITGAFAAADGDRLVRLRKMPPIKVFAAIGVAAAAFEAYLLLKWVTGPNFQRVNSGPDTPPTWMKLEINLLQVMFTGFALWLGYRWLVVPWRRERRVTFDGLFWIAWLLASVYDTASAYFHNWLTYNTYAFNMGSPLPGLPGWRAFAEPGAMLGWPMFWLPAAYAVLFGGAPIVGCWIMRRIAARFPSLSIVWVALILLPLAALFGIVLECVWWMRAGLYSETGFAVFTGRYGVYPLQNFLFSMPLIPVMTWLRYFVNDRGETFVERGVHQFSSKPKATAARFFAVVAAAQIILLGTYSLPIVIWTTMSSEWPWPRIMQDTSYFNAHICGKGTPRICPGGPGE